MTTKRTPSSQWPKGIKGIPQDRIDWACVFFVNQLVSWLGSKFGFRLGLRLGLQGKGQDLGLGLQLGSRLGLGDRQNSFQCPVPSRRNQWRSRNKRRFHHQALVEVKILEHLKATDVEDSTNIIHIKEHFYFRNHLCITFEVGQGTLPSPLSLRVGYSFHPGYRANLFAVYTTTPPHSNNLIL